MKKIIALLQARTGSSRLPGKVLKKILDKEMILHQLERTLKSKYIDKLLVVTTTQSSDDELASLISSFGCSVYRGDEKNVLKRFFNSLQTFNLQDEDVIVRLTGDCPLHDAEIIDESIKSFLKQKCDYLTNCVEPIYPDGFDVEVFTYKSLKKAYLNASLMSDLEHVTPYIRKDKTNIVANLQKKPIHPKWRLTVDEDVDFVLVKTIYNYFEKTLFSFQDIVKYLENNHSLVDINRHIGRNEGYVHSLQNDKEF